MTLLSAEAEPKLVVACLARNEAGRFWRSALTVWSRFADSIVVLDDGSTDATAEVARGFPKAVVVDRGATGRAWGRESGARRRLWEETLNVAGPGDYVFVLDADMIPARDPRPLLPLGRDAWAFLLFDLWGPGVYRNDSFWAAHSCPRIWMVRVPRETPPVWEWNDRGIHCGHLPVNLPTRSLAQAPLDTSLLHYGYYNPSIRSEKYSRYGIVRFQLTDHERAHAETITDPSPRTARLPFTPHYGLEYEGTDR